MYEEDIIKNKKISFIRKEDSTFDMISIRKKVRDELKIPLGSPFALNFF